MKGEARRAALPLQLRWRFARAVKGSRVSDVWSGVRERDAFCMMVLLLRHPGGSPTRYATRCWLLNLMLPRHEIHPNHNSYRSYPFLTRFSDSSRFLKFHSREICHEYIYIEIYYRVGLAN